MNLTRGAPRRVVVGAVGAATVVALTGALATDLGPWYQRLQQPAWKPPDIWFGPAWSLIFALTALAGLRAWQGAGQGSGQGSGQGASQVAKRGLLLAVYALNGALNVLWTLLFFRVRRPDWALYEVALLWLSVLVLMAVSARHDAWSPWLLVPYLGWVAFAAAINYSVVRMNPVF